VWVEAGLASGSVTANTTIACPGGVEGVTVGPVEPGAANLSGGIVIRNCLSSSMRQHRNLPSGAYAY